MCHLLTLSHILLLYLTSLNTVSGDKQLPSVIIIGSGAAGIAAASRLSENGFKNITILEAEDRIGGRIYSTRFNNYLVDLGSQWVHGEKGNIVFELASPLGLLEKGNFMDGGFELYDSSGIQMNETMASDIKEFFIEIVDNIDEYCKNKNGSIGQYFQNEFNKYFNVHPNLKNISNGLLNLFDKLQMEDEGGDTWWEVSTKSRREYYECPGANQINWMQGAYSTILDILMKRYPNPAEELPVFKNIKLNAKVSLINNDEKNGKAIVTTSGDTYFADHVIVTLPLGVLKEKYRSLFKPPLPKEKVETIKGLGFGSEAKIYLSFDKPWWKSKDPGFYFFWKDEDKAQLEQDLEKRWLLGVTRFSYVEHKPGLLYGWVTGKYSHDMELISDQKVFNHTIEVLQRFLGKYYNITMPSGMIRTKWNSNKNFKGTYSYFRTFKSDGDNVSPAILAKPIGIKKPIILFAGEATHPHHFSTVHGAIESGFREADRILKLYPNLKG